MDTRILALCELSNDLLYHKIPEHQLLLYLEEPLRLGTAAAKQLKGKAIDALYKEHQIEIILKEDGKAAFGMAYRGQITLAPDGCAVMVFLSSIRALAKHSEGGELGAVDYDTARQIHLAHEFFHYLEFQSLGYVSKLLPDVVTMEFLGMRRKASVNRCSEIAAHAFAKELLELEVLPNYYDYRYLINTGQMTEADFMQLTERYGQRIQGLAESVIDGDRHLLSVKS